MKTQLFVRCALVTSFVLFGLARESSAVVLLGNSAAADGGSQTVTSPLRYAVPFTMPNQGYIVSDVVFRLLNYNTATDIPFVAFYNNAAGSPGTIVGSALNFPTSSSDAVGNFQFSPASTITLNANQQYFLVIGASQSSFDWVSTSPNTPPSGTATFGILPSPGTEYRLSVDDGATYTIGSSVFDKFAIDATPVPEPASVIAIFSLLFPALAIFVHRRKRS